MRMLTWIYIYKLFVFFFFNKTKIGKKKKKTTQPNFIEVMPVHSQVRWIS